MASDASSPSHAEKHNSPITTSTPTAPSSAPTLSLTTPSSSVAVAVAVAAPPSPSSRMTVSSSSESLPDDADASNSESSSGVAKKKSGRGKVEMRKMEKESNLLVTFSKRKSGIFKKANEISILCGVHCAVILFSPARKAFSYGHPSVDHVVDRYLTGLLNRPIPLDGTGTHQLPQNKQIEVHNLSAELTYLTGAFEEAKKDGQRLDKMKEERVAGKDCKWGRPVEEMEGGESESFNRAMEDLKSKILKEAARRLKTPSGSSSSGLGGYQWFKHNYLNNADAAGTTSNSVFHPILASWGSNHRAAHSGLGGRGVGGRGGSSFSA